MTSTPAHVPARTAIVVVTFGAAHLLEENLATIDLAAIGAEAIVVDNFHSDAEQTAIASIAKNHEWALVQIDTNIGFGAAVNRGVAEAKSRGADTVLVLNPDARLDADAIAQLAEECRAEPRTLVSPRILGVDGSTWFRGGVLDLCTGRVRHGVPDGSSSTTWLSGACLMTSVELFEAIGGFDPDYFLYLEDVDLSWRYAAAGARLLVRDDLVAVHAVGGTQQVTGKSAVYYYYNCRNRLVFAAKHLSRRRVLRWLWSTPSISWEILRRGGSRRQLLTTPSLLWAGLRGTSSGVGTALAALTRPHAVGATTP